LLLNEQLIIKNAFSHKTDEKFTSFSMGFIETFKRNMKIIWNYKFNLINAFFNTLITYSLYFFVALIIPGQQITNEYYTISSLSFFFSGAILTSYTSNILLSGLGSLTSEMQQGTFETIAVSTFGLKKYIYAEILAEVIYTIVKSTVFLIPVILIFPFFSDVSVTVASFVTLLLLLFSMFVFVTAFTLVGSNFVVVIKRGREIAMVLMGLLLFLSGTLYPLNLFPKWLQILAYMSPLTQAVKAFRLCLFMNATISHPLIWEAMVILICSTIVLFALFLWLFKIIDARVKHVGSISFY